MYIVEWIKIKSKNKCVLFCLQILFEYNQFTNEHNQFTYEHNQFTYLHLQIQMNTTYLHIFINKPIYIYSLTQPNIFYNSINLFFH